MFHCEKWAQLSKAEFINQFNSNAKIILDFNYHECTEQTIVMCQAKEETEMPPVSKSFQYSCLNKFYIQLSEQRICSLGRPIWGPLMKF